MEKLSFTSEPPKEVGWYWLDGTDIYPKIVEVRITETVLSGKYASYKDWEMEGWLDVEEEAPKDAMWCGPLEPPK